MAYTKQERVFSLVGVLIAMFLGAIDQTIVSTALPKIVEDLQGLERYAWVATSYLLASTVLVPIYGRLADIYSRRSIELAAVTLFLVGSFACGLAGEFGTLPLLGDGMTQLIVFRGVQGLGGAGLFAMAFIVIADLFPPSERGKYQGLVGATFGISSVLGPWLGGLLTDYGGNIIDGVEGWRWVFYVNVPFGALALFFILTKMPKLMPAEKGTLNYAAAALLVAGLVPLVLGLQLDKIKHPWTSPTTLGLLGVGVMALTAFVFASRRSQNPILDLSLFKNRVFWSSNLTLFLLGGTFLSILIFLPLFMVNVLGLSATKAGTSLIPLSLGLVFGAIGSGQLVSRVGHYKIIMLISGAVLVGGVYLLSTMNLETTFGTATLYMVVCGLGLGPGFPLYTLAIQNAVEVHRVGQATSASQFFRQIGGTFGAAIMGTVLASGLAAAFVDVQAPTGETPSATTDLDRQQMQGGLEAIRDGIKKGFDAQFVLVEKALREQDPAAIEALQKSPRVPDEMKARLARKLPPQAIEGALTGIRSQLDATAATVADEVVGKVRNAFAVAITDIYRWAILLALLAWLSTWLIPELPLRKTLDRPAVAE